MTRVFHTVQDKAFSLACYEPRRGWESDLCRHETRMGGEVLFGTNSVGDLEPSCEPPHSSSSTLSAEQIRPLFLELGSTKSDRLVVNDAVRVDVDGDGEIEELVVAESTTKDGALTAIVIVKDDRFRLVATFDTWTKFRIIKEACTDADDDGVPELIVESLESGSLGYRLMEWDGRALQSLGYGQP